MGRIKIKDLPKDMKLSEEVLRKVRGGIIVQRGLLGLRGQGGAPALRIGIGQGDWGAG